MRSEAPPLLPILRSRTQGEVLAALLVDPVREWTVTELAGHLAIPLTTTQSELARLEAGGLVRSRKVGRSRLVQPDTSNPIVAPLTQIIMLTFGPRSVIGEEFANLDADRVVIFGSWAARLSGEPGPPPRDIDVLIVGDHIARDDVYAAAERAEARLGRPINPVVRTTHAWQHEANDPLLDEIQRRPLIEVMSDRSDTVGA
jgi:DNA-binding transcriptional ArsR family regulator